MSLQLESTSDFLDVLQGVRGSAIQGYGTCVHSCVFLGYARLHVALFETGLGHRHLGSVHPASRVQSLQARDRRSFLISVSASCINKQLDNFRRKPGTGDAIIQLWLEKGDHPGDIPIRVRDHRWMRKWGDKNNPLKSILEI